MGLPDGDPLNRLLDELRRAGERGAALTKQLLSLGRQRAVQPQAFDWRPPCATWRDSSGG